MATQYGEACRAAFNKYIHWQRPQCFRQSVRTSHRYIQYACDAACRYTDTVNRYTIPRYAGIVTLGLLLWSIISTGCAGFPRTQINPDTPYQPSGAEIQWQSLRPGIETADIHDARLPLAAHAVKIDLSNPAITVVTSEPSLFMNTGDTNSTGNTNGRVKNETTQAFARRRNTVVAFNAAPFKTRSLFFSMYDTIAGIHISDFQRLSKPNPRYGALLFYRDGTARIIDSQTEEALSADVRHAVGGFWTILREGCVLPQKLERRDSRTAVGLADGGKTLFVIAVEGENQKKSQGLSYTETAALMRDLGASDALQLDGGSSSTLVLQQNGKQTVIAPDRIWNVHIPVASNVGIVYVD